DPHVLPIGEHVAARVAVGLRLWAAVEVHPPGRVHHAQTLHVDADRAAPRAEHLVRLALDLRPAERVARKRAVAEHVAALNDLLGLPPARVEQLQQGDAGDTARL